MILILIEARYLQVTIQHTGEKEISLELTTPDGKRPEVILTGVPAGGAGQVDPPVIPLLAGEPQYSLYSRKF